MKWIKCTDKLPDVIGSYLVWYDDTVAWAFFNSKKLWCSENWYVKNVTHWMELPGKPQDA